MIKDGLGNIGTYKKSGDSLHIMLAKQDKFYRIFLHEKMLGLTPVNSKYEFICKEGCANIYIKSENATVNIEEEKIISGKVTSKEDFGGLCCANVINKTTNLRTGTDYYGQFVIKASKNDIIEISFIGLETIEFKVDDKKNYDIFLKEYVRKKTPKEIRREKRELRKKGFIHFEEF